MEDKEVADAETGGCVERGVIFDNDLDALFFDKNFEYVELPPGSKGGGYKKGPKGGIGKGVLVGMCNQGRTPKAACVHCKAKSGLLEGNKDYTCNGIRRDMARHLASCTYFKDEQTKTAIKVYLRGFNRKEKRGRDEGLEEGQVQRKIPFTKDAKLTPAEKIELENKVLEVIVENNLAFTSELETD